MTNDHKLTGNIITLFSVFDKKKCRMRMYAHMWKEIKKNMTVNLC